MKVFLTGGTGYLGSALRSALLAAGHQVTVLARRPPETTPDPRLEWCQGDLAEGPPPAEILHRHRAVIHSAACVRTWAADPSIFDRVNVQAWDELVATCVRVGVQKVIHTSSFMSLGPSPTAAPITEADRAERSTFRNDYERTKYLADQVTDRWLAKGAPIVTLYPGVIFGPGERTAGNLVGKMIWMIARRRFPGLIGQGGQVWNFAYLPDVARGHLLALDRAVPGRSYILGGENIALNSLVAGVQRRLGRRGGVPHLPIGLAEALGGFLERRAAGTGRAPDLTRGVAAVYRCHWSYDTSAAKRDLGYDPTPFDPALDATVEWAAGVRSWVETAHA